MRNEKPDVLRSFGSFTEITPEILNEYGFRGILTDLDDTLVTHNYPVPNASVEAWLKKLSESDIPVCIISNNQKSRVMSFVENLNIGYFFNSFKPRTHTLENALAVMNITKEEAVFIGDQLFTDIKAANNAGIRAMLVNPVGTKTTLYIKIKRKFERKYKS